MKKIMFNDRYGLTRAVLEGKKTMTRRMCPSIITPNRIEDVMPIYSKYKVGEVVAVAQSGKDIYHILQQRYGYTSDAALGFMEMYEGMAMWKNKLFTPSDLNPYKVQITGIKVEHLQDIPFDDIQRECVMFYNFEDKKYEVKGIKGQFFTRHDAFAALIDKVSGKGTWERNPYVFAYSFELVK